MAEPVTKRLRITGRVQGVGYRAWCVGEAVALGLEGWVRNRADGSVEVLARGPEESVKALIARCGEGPRFSVVEQVAVEDAPGEPGPNEPGPDGFEQVATM